MIFLFAGLLPYNASFGDKVEVGGGDTAYRLDALTDPIVFYNVYHTEQIYVSHKFSCYLVLLENLYQLTLQAPMHCTGL